MHNIDELKQSWLNGWYGTQQSIINNDLTSDVDAFKHVREK